MRIRTLALVVSTLACAVAEARNPTAIVLAPEPLEYCTVCHGVELMGNPAVDAPKLAGLPAWYVARQMQAFRSGWRGAHPSDLNGMEMRPQALVLTEAELAEAVRFAASVPARASAATVVGDIARGEALYPACAVCHGAEGEGNEALLTPPLTGQDDWYLATQLEHFRAGVRGASPGDTQGALMRAAAQTLPDARAISDLIAYLNTLQTQPEENPL